VWLVAIVALYYVERGPNGHDATTTTTTTTTAGVDQALERRTSCGRRPSWPRRRAARRPRTYGAASTYRVTVTGTNGPVWTVYTMGPRDTLEWQGNVASGIERIAGR
jgi:hypothetical protein